MFTILIPAFNEEARIESAICEVQSVFHSLGVPYELRIVDDGSSDRTAEIVRRVIEKDARVHLVQHHTNLGKGLAVRTGVKTAKGDWILIVDADLSAHPREMIHLVPRLEQCDMIIGSRRAHGTHIIQSQPLHRVIFGRLFNVVGVRWYLGLPYRDTQCGFKLFRREIADICARVETDGWVFDVELILRVRARGYRIVEVPVSWRNGRESKVRIQHIFSIVRELRNVRKISREELISTRKGEL